MVEYPRVPLTQVLRQDTEYITELEPRLYPKLSVKLYGRGVVLDEPTDGSTVKMTRHQLAKPGQVILSEIWAKKGAIGIVPPEGVSALVTSHFFLFEIDTSQLSPNWMFWLLSGNYFADKLDELAKGTTGYAAIRPKQFLALEIPLPALAEQHRIVTRIEELARRVEEARGLRREAVEQCDVLLRSIIFGDTHGVTMPTPMKELIKLREPDVIVKPEETYHFAGVYCFGKGVFRGQKKTGMEFAYTRLTRLRTDNFVYPKLMAWEGALGIVPPECEELVVSTKYPVFEVNQDRVLPETLDVYFRTPTVAHVVINQHGHKCQTKTA